MLALSWCVPPVLLAQRPFCSVDTREWPHLPALGPSIVSWRRQVIYKQAHTSSVVLTYRIRYGDAHTSAVVLRRRISYGDGDYQACGSFMLHGQGRPAAKTNLYTKFSVISSLMGRFQVEGVAEGSHRCRSGQDVVGGRSWGDIREGYTVLPPCYCWRVSVLSFWVGLHKIL